MWYCIYMHAIEVNKVHFGNILILSKFYVPKLKLFFFEWILGEALKISGANFSNTKIRNCSIFMNVITLDSITGLIREGGIMDF